MNKSGILWILVIAFWIIGDILTTFYGLNIGLVEKNPTGRMYLELGWSFIIFGKSLTTILGYAHFKLCNHLNMNILKYSILSLLLIGGISATVWNTYIIFF